MKVLFIFFLFSLLCTLIQGYKILGIFSYCAHSHFSLGYRLMREISDRGHNVTIITCFPQNKTNKNFREISTSALLPEIVADFNPRLANFGQQGFLGQLEFMQDLGNFYTEFVLRSKGVQDLFNSDEEFDLVISEHFVNDAMAIFHHRFNCPSILLAPGPTTFFNNHLVGNPALPSYVPNLLADYNSDMNFWERLENTYKFVAGELFVHWKFLPGQNKILQDVFPGSPDLHELIYNTSILFLITHISLSEAIPLQQNTKEIGGYHVAPPKPLPKDLQEFMDTATDGVIVFSMGSNLKSANFHPDKKRAILKAFSKIKQKVLWKFEADLPEKPDNVMIMSWLPQQDVLAHPNTVGFISHGGLLGTIEAVHYGVPILGLPVFWDQMRNMEEATRRGYGIRLNFESVNENNFDNALNALINNPKYRRIAKERSRVMHDQPIKQMDEAVFWIEYVIRHKGAPHLKSTAISLKWYQLYSLDIFIFLFINLIGLLLFIKFITKIIFSDKQKSDEKRKKKVN